MNKKYIYNNDIDIVFKNLIKQEMRTGEINMGIDALWQLWRRDDNDYVHVGRNRVYNAVNYLHENGYITRHKKKISIVKKLFVE